MLTPEFSASGSKANSGPSVVMAFSSSLQVEVSAHSLCRSPQQGLQRHDAWEELSKVQTHFVFVDYSEGQYQIQTGHHDGMTGLSSTVDAARESLGDRQRVGGRGGGRWCSRTSAWSEPFQKLPWQGSPGWPSRAADPGGLLGAVGPAATTLFWSCGSAKTAASLALPVPLNGQSSRPWRRRPTGRSAATIPAATTTIRI